ncbi:hypothetical protein CALCODRAFT_558904 [Calocera cornea HHB12733]|uniref:Uncharacterized protein n=1 Tax=Calocera cornea HHB12733 TaxID=1353952 RepID=A0A165CJ00_9BASI|nr:hypothetical protein CALCODRAFT_558904 [Calocera cornea HHB12733]
MPPRIRPPALAPRLLSHRRYVTGSSSNDQPYHPKVCALPFNVSPTDAHNAFAAMTYNLQELPDMKDVANLLLNKVRDRPIFGIKFMDLTDTAADLIWQRVKMTSMYLPTWVVNTCVSLSYVLRERGTTEKRVFGLLDATIPGHGYPPLANLWLSEPWPVSLQPRPFTPSMLKTTWYDDVGTIKYTVSPLKMLEMWKTLPLSAGEFRDQGIQIMPDAQLTGTSLLPLLRPVYIAEFILPFKNERMTLVLPAWINPSFSLSPMQMADYVYQPRNRTVPPSQASYYSPNTEANANIGITMKLMHDAHNPRSLWNTMGPKLLDVMKEARQNRVDWASIGGVDDVMWEDERIVSYKEKDWEERKMEVGQLQQQETLKTLFREERTDLTEEEVNHKAQMLSRFIDKLRRENKPTDGLDLEDMERAAARYDEEIKTGKQ